MNWYSDRRFCGFTKNSIFNTEVFVELHCTNEILTKNI